MNAVENMFALFISRSIFIVFNLESVDLRYLFHSLHLELEFYFKELFGYSSNSSTE